MAVNDRVELGGVGIEVQPVEIVKHVDHRAVELDHSGARQIPHNGEVIHVPHDRSGGCNRLERANHFRGNHIASMQNMVNPQKRTCGLSTQLTMGVGDNADQEGSVRIGCHNAILPFRCRAQKKSPFFYDSDTRATVL